MRDIFQRTRLWAWFSGRAGHRILWITGLGAVVGLLLAASGGALQSPPPPRPIASHTGTIPAAEFSRLIQDFSEEGGQFFADNFTSNESAYLYILKPLEKLGATGGAYVGVGPEQNFTYLAHIRPEIAFIVDIRRQAVIQHLMYKAIFQLAPTRAEFLSLLFSKPLDGPDAPKNDAPIEKILRYFFTAQSNEGSYRTNLIRLEKMIRQDFRFPLTEDDNQALTYLYSAFYNADLTISFRMTERLYGSYWGARFPNLAELILATDQDGNAGSFLATDSAYQFVRQLQRQNRVIPVVGDFGGTKALAAVADYLTRNAYTLSAFYTSNVEQYLFDSDSFPNFAENVRRMPINEKSVIIRSARIGGRFHPGAIPGHRMSPLLSFVSVFLKDYDDGLYPDYWSLLSTHYISGRQY